MRMRRGQACDGPRGLFLDGLVSRGQHCLALGCCAGDQTSGYRIPVQWRLNRRMVSLEAPPEPKASSQSIENQIPKAAWQREAICLYLGTSGELKRSCARGSWRPGRKGGFQFVALPPRYCAAYPD